MSLTDIFKNSVIYWYHERGVYNLLLGTCIVKMATSLYKAQEALKTCDEHQNEELSCFCKTCKKFICTTCAKTTHNGHDWDLVSFVATKRRKETPLLCRIIKQDTMPRCRNKLRVVEDNISTVEKASDDDMTKLEERRTAMINAINQTIDEQKRKREEIKEEKRTKLNEHRFRLKTKIEYLEKMTTSLDNNIGAYTDYDLLEMEQDMLTALEEVEKYDVALVSSRVTFVPGEINQELIEEMIGEIKESDTDIDTRDNISVEEVKTLKYFDEPVRSISPISSTEAWVGGSKSSIIKQLSSQGMETNNMTISNNFSFISINGDFIVTVFKNQAIRRVTSAGKEQIILCTKPLHPTWIRQTQTGEVLVSMRDSGDHYKLKSSSRRLVQRMTLTGKVLHTYEFQEDGITRLFTAPTRTAENGNSDICVINRTGDYTGELIVLHEDGRVRFTYRGQEGQIFNPIDVACDTERRIVVLEYTKTTSLYLMSSNGAFFRFLLSDMFDYPVTMALYQNTLWIGFEKGVVKVYKYTAE